MHVAFDFCFDKLLVWTGLYDDNAVLLLFYTMRDFTAA